MYMVKVIDDGRGLTGYQLDREWIEVTIKIEGIRKIFKGKSHSCEYISYDEAYKAALLDALDSIFEIPYQVEFRKLTIESKHIFIIPERVELE